MALTLLSLALVASNQTIVDPNPAINASLATCASLCFKSKTCPSFFYEVDQKLCYFSTYLYSIPKYAEDLVTAGHVRYYEWRHATCNETAGWLYYRPSRICFKFYDFDAEHQEAEVECEREGATLIHAANAISDGFVRHYSDTVDKDLWSGGHLNGSVWRWGEQEFGNYTNWMADHPKAEHDCLLIQKDKDTWESVKCDTNNRFMCQRSVVSQQMDCSPSPLYSV